MELLYNEEKFFCTKTELLNFMLTLPLTKSDMNGAILGLNELIFSGNTPADIQLVIFYQISLS